MPTRNTHLVDKSVSLIGTRWKREKYGKVFRIIGKLIYLTLDNADWEWNISCSNGGDVFLRQKKLYSTLSVKNEHFISQPRGSNSKTYRVNYFAPTFSKNIVLHTPCLGIPPQFRYVSRKRSIVDLKMRKRIVSPLHFSIIHPSLFYFISTRRSRRIRD